MRKLLIVVDMQRDFINGALGTRQAQDIVPEVISIIEKYPKENILVTLDTHTVDYLSTQEGKYLPIEHCVEGTLGWTLEERIQKALVGVKEFRKPGFGSIELGEFIRELAQKEELDLTLIGLCTDICVVSNALLLKAFAPEVPIHVVGDACAGVTIESHKAALLTMEMCQIDILNYLDL